MTETHTARDQIDLTPGAAADTDARTMVLIIYGLFLAGLLTAGVTSIVGVVLAYMGRSSAPTWAATHYTYQIRTFWLTILAALALGAFAVLAVPMILVLLVGLAMLLLVGPLFTALGVWYAVRCVVGLVRALDTRPHPNPHTLLV